MRRLWILLAIAGCAPAPDSPAPASGSASSQTLPDLFDDVREAGGVLVAAHRGGPAPGFPENALETLDHAYDAGVRVFEVDVAESQDGVLYLMHDRSLRRTAGHDGAVADTDWAVVRDLDLRDAEGTPTGFHPPTLVDTLDWAKERNAILELDRKDTTSFRNIVGEVREVGAEDHVLLITYSDDEAIHVAEIAPDLMMTAGARTPEQRERLVAAGVDMRLVVAWLGTREPDVAAMAELCAAGIEPAFGTLGRPGRRLDDQYAADGDASEYQALVDAGLTLLATDRPYFVVSELEADDVAVELLERATLGAAAR